MRRLRIRLAQYLWESGASTFPAHRYMGSHPPTGLKTIARLCLLLRDMFNSPLSSTAALRKIRQQYQETPSATTVHGNTISTTCEEETIAKTDFPRIVHPIR
jgi:hypothetical protein